MIDAMDSFTSDALIERWTAAYVWANGKQPDQVPAYENGWFVWRNSAFVTSRSRRKEIVNMIVRLENRGRPA
jgi:hypothetical protein